MTFELAPHGSPELVRRLVPFGISENGHYFAWDAESRDEAQVTIRSLPPSSLTSSSPALATTADG